MPEKKIRMDDPILTPKGYDFGNLLSIAERIKRDFASGKIKMEKVRMSLYGTEELTDLLVFLAKFASVMKDAVDDDGKIGITDAAKFVELIFPLIAAIKGIQEVPKELGDLDAIEKEELIIAVKNHLDLHENDVAAVEAGLQVIFGLLNFLTIVGVIKPAGFQE